MDCDTKQVKLQVAFKKITSKAHSVKLSHCENADNNDNDDNDDNDDGTHPS